MALTNEEIEKIILVRKLGNPDWDISCGISYRLSKRALIETNWDVKRAIELIRETSGFGTYIVKG